MAFRRQATSSPSIVIPDLIRDPFSACSRA